MRNSGLLILACCVALTALPAAAQQSDPAAGIDVEIYNPSDGSNTFVLESGSTFWANVYIRPGTNTVTCEHACGTGVAGGSANLAAAVIDIEFDPAKLTYLGYENNPATAAVDGLIQIQNLAEGRIGWALAGDWDPDADPENPSVTLATPCDMGKLNVAGWAFRLQFSYDVPSSATLHIRRESDDPAFPLSFADICGSEAFKVSNDGIDEVIDAMVSLDQGEIFSDGFESGNTSAW